MSFRVSDRTTPSANQLVLASSYSSLVPFFSYGVFSLWLRRMSHNIHCSQRRRNFLTYCQTILSNLIRLALLFELTDQKLQKPWKGNV
jgi:hypothetical protein